MPQAMEPRIYAAMAYDSRRGRVVVVGGNDNTNATLGDVWEYDGYGWVAGPPLSLARQRHAMVFDEARGLSLIYGGQGGGQALDEVWEYDGLTWTQGPSAPAGMTPRWGMAMGYDRVREKTVVFGGYPGPTNETWEYDGTSWAPGGSPGPGPRGHAAMAYDASRRKLVLFGGTDSVYLYPTFDDTWEYDGSWVLGPTAPSPAGYFPREGSSAAFDSSRNKVVIYGGYDLTQEFCCGSGFLDDTWEYDGTTWSRGAAAPPGLGPRTDHAMAYDSRRGTVVLTDGSVPGSTSDPTARGALISDVWEYDGTQWTPGATPPPAKPARRLHRTAFDAANGVIVLFGGIGPAVITMADTWLYDGANWALAPSGSLSHRWMFGLAYDESRSRTLLFAGESFDCSVIASCGSGFEYNDTWEWNGMSWSPGPSSTMLDRYGHSMFYNTRTSTVMHTGGFNDFPANAGLLETWELLPSGWTRGPDPPLAMGARLNAASAFDSSRGAAVISSGRAYESNSSNFDLQDDVWELRTWCPGLSISPTLLPDANVATSYQETLVASGGAAPYRFTITGGNLPPGLALTSNGVVAGTPRAQGSFSFTVDVVDAGYCVRARDYVIDVLPGCPVMTVSPASLPDAWLATPYQQTLTVTGGTAPHVFAVVSGSLPPGLTLSSSGAIAGTPTAGGTYSFTVRVTDAAGCLTSWNYDLEVRTGCPVMTISPASLPDASLGDPYSQTLTVTGGTPPHVFSVTAGSLPPGLTLSSAGVIAGTPTAEEGLPSRCAQPT